MKNILSLFGLLILITMINNGCEEIEVLSVSDEDEITRYLEVTEEGIELFRKDSLYSFIEYELPFDTATYTDVLLDIDRNITISIKGPVQISNLGSYKEALVIVNDVYEIRTNRIVKTDTTFHDTTRTFTRYGYFLKLLNDSYPFLGWKLYGYNSIGTLPVPAVVEIRSSDDTTSFHGDIRMLTTSAISFNLSFLKLDQFPVINKGDTLFFDVKRVTSIPSYYFVTYDSQNGFSYTMMDKINNDQIVDTVVVPDNLGKLWNNIVIQAFQESEPAGKHLRTWTVPYRLNLF
ncbi:MAG: hypothetical protein U9N54_05510 [candidate division Zixibacteria bacterium]|nr:hypothetical protein [candidate division Zixibacteria bacterium]